MLNSVTRFFTHGLVLAMIATALTVGGINIVFADEKPQTLSELMQNIVEEQRDIQKEMHNISDMMIVHDNYVDCRSKHGFGEEFCRQEYEAFQKALDEK